MSDPSDIIQFHVPEVGLSFRATLLVDENPDVVQNLQAQLPLESVLGHVVIAGETFWTPTRIVHLGRNNMVQRHQGAVYLNAPGQSICLTYGKITESATINKFAEVFQEDLLVLERIGKLVYEQTVAQPRHKILKVVISSEQSPAKLLPLHPATSEAATEVVSGCCEAKALIEKEIDHIWLEEPVEFQKVRWGVIDSGAGTGEQYFTVMVHLEAYLMVIGGDAMYRFLKLAQYDDIPLPALNRLTREFLVGNFDIFEFMADLGLPSMHEIGQKYSDALSALQTKDEYIELTGAMQTYMNRMHRWSYFIFPWHLGVAFPHRKPEEVLALSKAIDRQSLQ
ncbi:Cyclophilin-like protein [Cordyceps fumosorosea ARSEF 2679]|uniref:Cyclophilin-like protein n=1 Tax=Cordyceps fumosorosea (strain ARSEF 2679) TaxID=1081104 RepID=A0A167XBD7_CORFA|nr:Cyclophilin-like protein [Cordyceps fumosorosea ARSEF 2679]OAA64759.1 Cyclophilin-like protein [Cordyceps fumosorosea ARSEF 2679]